MADAEAPEAVQRRLAVLGPVDAGMGEPGQQVAMVGIVVYYQQARTSRWGLDGGLY